MNESAKRIDKPWGYEIWWARTDRYVGKLLHINAGESLSLQYHNVKDETILVQAGTLLFETGLPVRTYLPRTDQGPGGMEPITPAARSCSTRFLSRSGSLATSTGEKEPGPPRRRSCCRSVTRLLS